MHRYEASANERIDLSSYALFQIAYFDSPARFVRDCLHWQHNRKPTAYQNEILEIFPEKKKASIRAPHGVGKTTVAAWFILWFSLTRDRNPRFVDWKIPTTASAWRQLTKFLWPEVHKWARLVDWQKIGRPPFEEGRELLKLNLKLETGEAFSAASNQPATMEGAHADSMLYIFDESKTIPDSTFDVAEGAMIGAGSDTGIEALALSISTPGIPLGRFYDIQRRKPGYEDWWVRHITLQEGIDAGRISVERVGRLRSAWGEKSAIFQNRVLGEFAAGASDSTIPLTWVEAAIERWKAFMDKPEPLPLQWIGVDVSYFGKDQTVLALRSGVIITELRKYADVATTETTGVLVGLMTKYKATAIVDIIGYGAGIHDALKEQQLPSKPFVASARSDHMDKTGELGFVNLRSAAWWNLREMLDPDNGMDVMLPEDDDLIGELTTPLWKVQSGGRIQIESKDDVKRRLEGRSTDCADAVIQAFANQLVAPTFTIGSGVVEVGTAVSKWRK